MTDPRVVHTLYESDRHGFRCQEEHFAAPEPAKQVAEIAETEGKRRWADEQRLELFFARFIGGKACQSVLYHLQLYLLGKQLSAKSVHFINTKSPIVGGNDNAALIEYLGYLIYQCHFVFFCHIFLHG